MSEAILELRNVTKTYGSAAAVDGVSVTLSTGEFLSFLGPSGSGKTTTLAMIAGLVEPSSGEIFLKSQPLNPLPPYRRNIGMVFQNYALFPHMTVTKNISFPLEMRRMPSAEIKERVARVLSLVGLASYGSRLPHQLSGGQQQRIALARAMVFEPPILLMDEPLGALDKKLREQMQLEIRRLHRELGMSIIYVTHDQEEALVMSDRIAVFDSGRIEQVGTPTELYERPATRFVAEFIGESNVFPGIVTATNNGFITTEMAGTRLRGVAIRPLTPGARSVISIRPERIVVQAGNPPSGVENTIEGRVADVVYLGRMRKYVVQTPLGTEAICLQQTRTGNEPRFEIGATVSLQWRAEDAAVLPDLASS
jgi:putative spermidine/putrescine transport system ATP-binding protein